jgi:antirestriction protein ArdC
MPQGYHTNAFDNAGKYYATALHELGHATGHPSRLDRDLSGGFGSESYAKEELRAEISSLMAGTELGIGHDPQQHTAYVKSWIKILKDDPKEILNALKRISVTFLFLDPAGSV